MYTFIPFSFKNLLALFRPFGKVARPIRIASSHYFKNGKVDHLEPVRAVEICGFVIASVDVDKVWVTEPHGEEKDDAFHGLGPFVNDVAVEKVVIFTGR